MIEVYRIEHRVSRVGPFQTEDPYTQDLAQKAGRVGYLKAPSDDGLGLSYIPWCFVFGSPSLDALKRWVFLGDSCSDNADIVRELHQRGFVLAEYLVEDADCQESWSGLQVAFDAESAREEGLVQYKDLSELLARAPLVFCTNDRSTTSEYAN